MAGDLTLFPANEREALPGPDRGVLSVSAVTRRARQLIEAGFRHVWVKGEITNFKVYRSGHWYFSLRDETAQIRCVMWRDDARRVRGRPQEGMQVFAECRPTVWEERGEFRLTVKRMLPTDASGVWDAEMRRVRRALERDGLLDPARKRPLPRFPSRLAVVTSPDGAALRDILAVLHRRWPAIVVYVVGTRVQGDGAERDICRALQRVNRLDVDLTIVGRGGGSREDLWVFNHEQVVRAVAALRSPTISAVGHETDVTLTDLVADVRAATPSAAAEAAVPDRDQASAMLDALSQRLSHGVGSRARFGRERLARTADRMASAAASVIQRRRSRLGELAGMLDALSPLRVLARGYAVARDAQGQVLASARLFPPGRRFRLTLADGEVPAVAEEDHE